MPRRYQSWYNVVVARMVLVCSLLMACGARVGLPVEGERDASTDAPMDAPDASSLDAFSPDTSPPPRPPVRCVAERGVGNIVGNIPGFEFDFPYVVAGVESFGTHSCPRLFIRAGESPTFGGAFLEIEAHFSRDEGFVPGMRGATLTVYPEGRGTAEPWFEEIVIEVDRVDGIESTRIPPDEWRAVAFIDHHDATTDLVGSVDEAPYCNDFPICI